MQQSHTFNIDLQAYREEICQDYLGSIEVRNPNKFRFDKPEVLEFSGLYRIVITPVITSTDESLRKYSPEQ